MWDFVFIDGGCFKRGCWRQNFGKRQHIARGGCINMCNMELDNLYCSENIVLAKLKELRSLSKVKCSHYKPCVAQRVCRGIALLFHDCGTRRGWVVSSTPQPHFTPGKDLVPIFQEAGWAPGPVWMGGKSRPHRDSIPDRPVHSQSLYRLIYLAHKRLGCHRHIYRKTA